MDLNSGRKVQFATRERIKNRWRFKETDDSGALSTTDDGVHFRGKRHDFEVSEIQATSMVKSSPLLAIVIIIPLFVPVDLLLNLLFNAPDVFDIGGGIVTSVLIVIWSLFMRKSWVCVEYRGADGQPREAFFSRFSYRKPKVLLNQLRKLTVEEK